MVLSFEPGDKTLNFDHSNAISWPGLLEAWLVLTSVKYHENLYILIPLTNG